MLKQTIFGGSIEFVVKVFQGFGAANKLLKVVPAASGLHGTPVSALGFALASPILCKTNHQIVRPLVKR
ncbi:MAG: hypothetical protein K6L81_06170 [Agarilytica sp.]